MGVSGEEMVNEKKIHIDETGRCVDFVNYTKKDPL
jgi:hypothetical protein